MESVPEGFDARYGRSLLTKAQKALEGGDEKEAARLSQGLKKGLELGRRRATWRGKISEAKLKLRIAEGAGMDVDTAQEKIEALEERVQRNDFKNVSQALQGALRGLKLTGHAGKAWKRLEDAKKRIGYARERGGQTEKAQEFLQKAQEALQQADFAKANQLAGTASRAADYARKYARAVDLIAGVQRKLEAAADRGADVAEGKEYLANARKALKTGVYADVQKWTRTAREFGDRARKTQIGEASIKKVEKALEAEAAEGSDLSETHPVLEAAWKALAGGKFGEVTKHVRKANALAKAAARSRKSREALDLLTSEIEDLRAMKADPTKAETAAARAQEALEQGNWPAYRKAWGRAQRETAKARRERERELVLNTVEMLVDKAGKGGVSASGARELLVEVEKALSKGSHSEIETLVEAKFEAEATKRENELIRRMAELRTTQAELKVAGIEVSAAAGLLEEAGEALKDNRIKEADNLLTRSEEATEGLKQVLSAAALRALEDLQTELTSLDRLEVGVPQAQAFHDRAEAALTEGDALQALDLASLGLEACKKARTDHFDKIAEKELEAMRSKAALKEAGEKLSTAREFAALLDRTEIDHEALDDVVDRAETALGKKEVQDLEVLLQVVAELEASLKVALKKHIATRLGELERIIQELKDLEEAGEFRDALTKLQKALKKDSLAEALEEAQSLEVKVAEAQAREAQRLAEAQTDELARLSALSARVKGILESLWRAGIDVSDSQETFHRAVAALQENELAKATPLLEELEETASAIQSDLASAAHEFIASAKRQLKKAEKNWKPMPEARDMLLTAKELFEENRFDEAIEVARIAERKTRSQKEQVRSEARGEVTRRILEFQERLFHLKEVLRDLRRADISIEDSEEVLTEVEESLGEADFETADGRLAELEDIANGLASGLEIAAKELLKSVGRQLKKAKAEGLSVPRGENVYGTAQESLKAGRYVEALEYCKVIEDIVDDVRIKAKLANMDEVVDDLQQQLRSLEGPGVRLERASSLLDEAREAAALGEQDRALALTQGVSGILKDLEGSPLAKGRNRKGEEDDVSVEDALDILDQVESSWETGDTEGLEEMLAAARTKLGADGTPTAKAAIKEVGQSVRLADKLGLEVEDAKEALTEAKRLLKSDPGGALATVGQARDLLRTAAKDLPPDARPSLELDIPEKGLEEGQWSRFEFYVKNSGKTPASDVNLRLRGDVEVKGLEPVKRLAPRESRLVGADVKARTHGPIPLEVDVTYRGMLDGEEVQVTETASVDASPTGTYLVEDAFLVHADGRLISHQTRKIQDDIDEDVFSGMLTVVQDFVKDSFRSRTKVGLRRLEFGESRIIIERGPDVYLAAVLLGEEPDLLSLYMVELINEIERKFGEKLEKWTGLLSELDGIEEVCKKLCYFTKEGWIVDPEGTKTAIGETINLIRGGKALGLDLSESETLLERAKGVVETDVQNAWSLIEDAVEKALATQQELQKKLESGVKALSEDLEGLSLLGHGLEGGKEDLQEAEAALAAGDYEQAARVISNLDDTVSALKEEVVGAEIESTVGRLSRTVDALEQEGADVTGLKEELGAAQAAWSKGQLGQVAKHLETAHEEARDLKRTYLMRRHREELDTLSEMYEKASAQGLATEGAKTIVELATQAVEREDVDELDVLLPQARQAVQAPLQGEFEGREPEVHIEGTLPHLQLDAWARYEMELTNKGTWAAKDIRIEFGDDIEVKGSTAVAGLGPGETKGLTVGLRPSKAGTTLADMRVSYLRLLDDAPYVAHYIRDIKVSGKGTYAVEDALLFLPDGTMLVHESQQFREELDEELFLSMIQGVQQFLGDAFASKQRVGIKRMDFKDSKVLLERGEHCYLGTVVVGDEPELLPLYLLQLLYEAEERHGDRLADWQDDPDTLESLRAIVRKALLVSQVKGADLGELASSPITQGLLEGLPAKERKARIEAMMPTVEKALVEKGPVAGLAAVRSALAPKQDTEGKLSPTERPQGEKGGITIELDDESLREFIEIVKEVDKAVRKARGKAGLEYHWPVPRIAIRAKTPNVAAAAENFKTMILSHANAREIDILESGEIWHGVDLNMTINEDVVERSYKTWSRKIQLILMSQDPWKIKTGIDKGGYEMGIEGQMVKIDGDMVSFQAVVPPHVVVQEFADGMVFMDARLTEEEEAVGFANEIMKIVLEARKDLELEDSDPVLLGLVASERLRLLLGKQKQYIMHEANVKELRFVSEAGAQGYVADVEISDETFTIAITASGESS